MLISAVQSLSGELPKLRIGAAKPETCSTADPKTNRPVAQPKTTATTATNYIQLNDRWRVRLDDPLQWILEHRRAVPLPRTEGAPGAETVTAPSGALFYAILVIIAGT